MIYLDYSATTPVNDEVLDTYNKVTKEYIGNANSIHSLGRKSKLLEEQSTHQIASLLGVKDDEIIYTSGASESNNTAIKGVINLYQNRGKHIITTPLEHDSVEVPLTYFERRGFKVDYLKLKADGTIDLDYFKSILDDETILVTLAAVSSEIGIIQPYEEIGKILKDYPKCFFHVDLTQAIGKIKINLEDVDMASFSTHKLFGPKGIGVLVKKEHVVIEPLIQGGKSTTNFRAGTPALPLIASTAKALRLVLDNMDEKNKHVKELSDYLKNSIKDIVEINSTEASVPHIVNFSAPGFKAETLLHALEEKEIYVSTKTACSASSSYSKAVMTLTNDVKRSSSSIRVSISYLTTKEEIDTFIKELKEILKSLPKQ
jgi:cysteine desulfurase